VIALMDENAAAQGAVNMEFGPATTTNRVALVIAIPGELHVRPAVLPLVHAVYPAFDCDESKLTGLALAELDESRANQLEGILIPEIHFGDAPFSRDAHHWSSLGSRR
jgi:hypothetical protein